MENIFFCILIIGLLGFSIVSHIRYIKKLSKPGAELALAGKPWQFFMKCPKCNKKARAGVDFMHLSRGGFVCLFFRQSKNYNHWSFVCKQCGLEENGMFNLATRSIIPLLLFVFVWLIPLICIMTYSLYPSKIFLLVYTAVLFTILFLLYKSFLKIRIKKQITAS